MMIFQRFQIFLNIILLLKNTSNWQYFKICTQKNYTDQIQRILYFAII